MFHIQRQLTAGGVVTESESLLDRTSGMPREVDVVVRGRVGEHDVIVSVECRDHRRRATVEWVEQMLMKHQSLPTSKLILVSASGFTRSALLKAGSNGIEALTLEEAAATDWTALLGEGGMDIWAWRIRGCGLVVASDSNREHVASPDVRLFDSEGSFVGTLEAVIHAKVLRSGNVFQKAAQYAREIGEPVFGADVRLRPPLFAEDRRGGRHAVELFRLYLEFHDVTAPLRPARYRDLPIAYGQGQSPAGDFELTLIQTPTGPTGAMSVTSATTGDVQTVDLQFTDGDSSTVFFTDRVLTR